MPESAPDECNCCILLPQEMKIYGAVQKEYEGSVENPLFKFIDAGRPINRHQTEQADVPYTQSHRIVVET